jgi:hypothetical protein
MKSINNILAAIFLAVFCSCNATAQTYHNINTSGSITISTNSTYIIEGDGSVTANTIKVNSGVVANVTINDVNIDVSGIANACAFDMSGATVNLTFTGTNTLKSGLGKAGLQVPSGATLVITEESAGSLTTDGSGGGAGIGGGRDSNSGSITINGGMVIAISSDISGNIDPYGSGGAGIGGGGYSGGNGGTIIINGGTVVATGGNGNANYGSSGAGIGGGGGYNGSNGGSGGTIIINGGMIDANGKTAGLQNGDYGSSAGIGGGYNGHGGNITINGGTITAKIMKGAHDYDILSAAIGGCGQNGDIGNIVINGGTITTIRPNNPNDIDIGGGNTNGSIIIRGGSINATKFTKQPTNGNNVSVYINTLMLMEGGSPVPNKKIMEGNIGSVNCDVINTPPIGYGIKDVKTDGAGKIYLHLPQVDDTELVELTAENGRRYNKSYARPIFPISEILDIIPYGISLDKKGTHTFPTAIYGYGEQTSLTVTVINAGYNATGTLDVILSGANPSAFKLSSSSIFSIDAAGVGNFTVDPNMGLAIGTHTATVTVSGTNGITASFHISFTVNKKDITIIDATIEPKTYDGMPDATVMDINFLGLANGDNLILGTDYDVSGAAFNDADAGENKIVQMNIVLKNTDKAKNYNLTNWEPPYVLVGQTISKATLTAAHLDYTPPVNATYDGQQHGFVATPTLKTVPINYTGIGTVVVKYESTDNGVSYPLSATLPVNADEYTVRIDVNEGSNFNAITGLSLGNFTIDRATLTVTPNSGGTKVYGNTDPTFSYVASGWKNNENEILLTGTLTRESGEDVGKYNILQGSLSAGNNYTINFTSNVEFEVTPAELTITPNSGQTKAYGDIEPKLTYTSSGVKFDETVLFSGMLERAVGEDVGDYPISFGTLSLADSNDFKAENYTLVFSSTLVNFTIIKAMPTESHFDFDFYAVSYDGLEHSVIVMLNNSYSGMGAITVKYDGSTSEPVNAKIYAITVDIGEGTNFESIEDLLLGDFIIDKATQTIIFNPETTMSVESGAYSLMANAVTSSAPGLPILFRTSDAELADISGNTLLPKQSGTVIITAYVAPDSNYEDVTEVSHAIVLTSSRTGVTNIDVHGATLSDDGSRYIVDDPKFKTVTVVVTPQDVGAKVIHDGVEASTFTVDVNRGGAREVSFTVISQNGAKEEIHTITIEQLLAFEEYIGVKWNILFILNLRKLTETMYNPSLCRWYHGNKLVGTGFFYKRGDKRKDHFIAGETYHFELKTPSGIVRSTEYTIPQEDGQQGLFVYPNPVETGQTFYLSLDNFPSDDVAENWLNETMRELDADNNDMDRIIHIYDSTGKLMLQTTLESDITELCLARPGIYIIHVNGQTAKIVVE